MERKKPPGATPSGAHRLTLRQLQTFVAVARAGSTTAAAQEISLSQSATSASLNELEDLLGGRLFNRVGGRLVLNEHGRSMLPQARFLLDAAHSMEAEFGHAGVSSAPSLRVAASTTIGNWVLPRVIAAYRRRQDAARIAVEIGNTSEVARAVAHYEVDVGFIEGPSHEANVRLVPWKSDELVVACAPTHELARGASKGRRAKVALAQLAEAKWLLREPGSGTREVVERALQPHLHRVRSEIELGSTEAIVQAAAEGVGLACVSRYAVADMAKLGRLVVLRTALPALRRTLYLVQHERRYVTPTLEGFMAHCLATDRKRG
ncbi:MAG TPA: LysR family transcriptional regulator [Usitatibacter sp.]|nr:LysR family transcriptional regulator [Usitatibacter sp.]